ncbi:MAG: response regulator [Thermodesulfobacteriota bacterium]|nr:response regulator [Thermodesulfobacteriota bacterium]
MKRFCILIADRNRHVREFLRRELMLAGYLVQVAKDGREVMKMTGDDHLPDLLILDLDLPYVNGLTILEELETRDRPLPVIVHTFHVEWRKHPAVQRAACFWEKRGNNIQGFKATVAEVLEKWYPRRAPSGPSASQQGAEQSPGRG